MFISRKKEIINLTSFDQSKLKNIGKFYNIYNEIDYIKEIFEINFRKVKNFNKN